MTYYSLEGAQAGLSWITILRKRDAYQWRFVDGRPIRNAWPSRKHRRGRDHFLSKTSRTFLINEAGVYGFGKNGVPGVMINNSCAAPAK